MRATLSRPTAYDVVVIGGGPGGATLATFLQRQGHRCLILEKSSFPRYHIGESLIPHTYGTLDRLGLLPRLRKSHFPRKYSVRFVSEAGQESHPFYFFETVAGERSQTWQVERSEFDQICLNHARETGVNVLMRAQVQKVLFSGSRAVGVRISEHDGRERDIAAKVVVDASGRSAIIGKQLDLMGPVPGLEKASIWSYWTGGKRLKGVDEGETTVFMLPERGWFWYIPLPDDVVSVGVVASPKYLFRHTKIYPEAYQIEVHSCAPLLERLRDARQTGAVRGIPTLAYRNRQIAGDGWVMIGDAAAFLDPIYSSGLYLAMASAELAAECVHQALKANDASAARLGAFREPLMAGVDVIRRLIHAFYDPTFSFPRFVQKYPELRPKLIDCLIGDVVGKDMRGFTAALETMTPPPPPLEQAVAG